LAYIHDISEQQRYEKEINMLAHAIMSISECVSVTDMQNKILFVNDAFEETYGYTREELIGEQIDIIRSPNNPPDTMETILPATLESGWQGEILNKSKSGREFPVFLSTSVINDESNNPVALIGVAKDMTERKLLENQLRQSQKMEAIGSLAGGVAHDFNNLLTVIRGYNELLISKLSKNDPLVVSVKQIDKAAERAESLTRQLLAFSRRQILKPSVIDLNELFNEMEKMLRRIIGEDINFLTVLDPQLGKIKADRGQIEQVIMNIVVNARDAMIEGGKLTVETQNVYLDDKYVQNHPPVETGEYVLLAISDSGLGMDRETQAHIFEPFFTTKETGKGTGLGLATVYGIVKQSGGFVWVYSELNKGTTFKIYLPMVDEEVDDHETIDLSHPKLKGDETILIVEDEEDVRALIHETLHLYGYEVLEAPHGDSALILCEKFSDKISLIITDVVMPKMSGRELVDIVVSKHPGMKVLYMSGYTDNAIVHKGLLEAGTQFIQKPFTPLALLRKVREVLESE
jgi:PAS domain S-box-containing protein